MNYSNHHIARKYARAFINTHSSKVELDSIKLIDECRSFFSKNMSGLYLIHLAPVNDNLKLDALKKVLSRFELYEFDKLVKLLLADRRVYLLPLIFNEIISFILDRANIEIFQISSAAPLDEQERKALETFLSEKIEKKIQSRYIIDPTLIAGIRLQSPNHLWEFSIRKELARLAAAE